MPWKTNDEGCDACEVDQGTDVCQQEIILAMPKLVATDYTDGHRWNEVILFFYFSDFSNQFLRSENNSWKFV